MPCPQRFGGALKFEHSDRWRLGLATVVTVVALPLLVAEGRSTSAERPPAVAAVGVATGFASELTGGRPAADPTAAGTGATEPAAANATPTRAASPPPSVIEIGVRAPWPDTTRTGKAGFRRWVGGGSCSTPVVPAGTRLVVTNLDNGQSTACVNSPSDGLPAGALVVLRTDVFERISDLAQAPVPVRISWER